MKGRCAGARLMDGVTRLWAMRRSKWDGADGGLCSRRVWVGDAPDGGARLRMVSGAFSVCLTCLRIANGMFGI